MDGQRIAVLMTCHNRQKQTLACLESLSKQTVTNAFEIDIHLVDAGSTDGTVEAIRNTFPEVNVIIRDDSFFWCGGMREAFKTAEVGEYDYYIWLNDDTMLNHDAVAIMLDTAIEVKVKNSKDSIIVGSVCDPDSGKHTYGGVIRTNKRRPIYFEPVIPSDSLQQCDTMNGNCVMVPKTVALRLGNLSKEFKHRMADTDYGLRATSQGISIWVARGYLGCCSRNSEPFWQNPKTPLLERLKAMNNPKALPPFEWFVFTKRHAGFRWPLHVISLFLRVLFPKVYSNAGK